MSNAQPADPTPSDLAPADLAPADRAPGAHRTPLTERDIQILAFEREWLTHSGAKEEAIRVTFQLSAARYYQLLGALVASPAALAHDPMLIKRLHRIQDARVQSRRQRHEGTRN